MKAVKYSRSDTTKIDLGTKVIYKYPSPTTQFDVGRMVVNGRHPLDPAAFAFESDCSFVMYILSGSGTVYAGPDTFAVTAEDVVFVPARTNFAVEGKLSYLTFDSPSFYSEQSSEITP